jgi:hypothetical protein
MASAAHGGGGSGPTAVGCREPCWPVGRGDTASSTGVAARQGWEGGGGRWLGFTVVRLRRMLLDYNLQPVRLAGG